MDIKIYQLVPDPYNMGNPYVSSLMDEISATYNNIKWGYGLDGFWTNDIYSFDIIHIHWPNLLLNSRYYNKEEIEKRLDDIKKRGIKIVVTCHNLEPHYTTNKDKKDVYVIVYSRADVFIHLGKYSLDTMSTKYSQAKHVVIYHHTYDKLYHIVSREDSIKHLKLDPQKKYILCFGAFRDKEERNLVDKALSVFREKGIDILAPNYYKIDKKRNVLVVISQWFKCKLKNVFTPGLHINGWFVRNDDLPYYYGASDIALLHRVKILNSGNLPMAFLMGKVVVGPNVGNVGKILKETGNPVFEVDNQQSLIDAINEAFTLTKDLKNEENQKYAIKYFSTTVISKQLYDLYCSIQLEDY